MTVIGIYAIGIAIGVAMFAVAGIVDLIEAMSN